MVNFDIEMFAGPVIGIVVILVLIQLVSLPYWLLKNSLIGAVMLYIFNFIGIFTIKITFIHCLIVGVCGVPGLVILLIYLNFFK